MENNNEKKERRISFAAEADSVFKYERENQETTISSDDEFTADLTFDNSKQLSIFNEPAIINDFINRDIKDLVENSLEKQCVSLIKDNEQDNEQNNEQDNKQDNGQNNEKEDICEDLKTCDEAIKDLELHEVEEPNSSFSKKIQRSPRPKKRQSFSPFRRNSLKNKTKQEESSPEQENELNLVESSVMSNNSIDTTDIINTQKLKFMVPQTKKQKINITELFASKGIMFLDIISFANTRRNTLSKTRKEVDPTKILFYKNFSAGRIKFFDEFVDDLKTKGEEYGKEIEAFADENEEVSEIIASEELNKTVKSKMLDARNIAKVKWYELRAKKELAFNEIIIRNKNNLQSRLSEIKGRYDSDKELENKKLKEIEELKMKIKDTREQLERNTNDKESHEKKLKDIAIYEDLNENLSKTVEEMKIKFNKCLLHRQIQENHVKDIKKAISSLLENMREVCVSEDQLNNLKDEFEKLCSIFDFSLRKVEKNSFNFVFCGYTLEIGPQGEGHSVLQAKHSDPNNIPGQFMVSVLKGLPPQTSVFRIIFLALKRISVFCEFVSVLNNISLSNQIEIFLKDKKLFVEIVFQDFKLCKTVKLNLSINDKMECTVYKDADTYLYSLYEDKGFLLNHVE